MGARTRRWYESSGSVMDYPDDGLGQGVRIKFSVQRKRGWNHPTLGYVRTCSREARVESSHTRPPGTCGSCIIDCVFREWEAPCRRVSGQNDSHLAMLAPWGEEAMSRARWWIETLRIVCLFCSCTSHKEMRGEKCCKSQFVFLERCRPMIMSQWRFAIGRKCDT